MRDGQVMAAVIGLRPRSFISGGRRCGLELAAMSVELRRIIAGENSPSHQDSSSVSDHGFRDLRPHLLHDGLVHLQ
jgi:hypothetical protein